jgi:hypothetical protein
MGRKKFEQIEQFLDGNLSGEELKDFLSRLEEDSKLREKVEAHKAARVVMQSMAEDKLRSRMAQWKDGGGESEKPQDGEVKKRPPTVIRRLVSYGVAASLLAFVVGASYLFIDAPRYASNMVAERNTAEYTLAERSAEESGTTYFQEIYHLYANEKWIETTETIKQHLPVEREEEIPLIFLLADATYRSGNHGEAIAIYASLIEDPEMDRWHVDRAEWKMLLIQLEQDPFNKRLHSELDRIATDSNHFYQQSASNLLAEMSSFRYQFGRWIFR